MDSVEENKRRSEHNKNFFKKKKRERERERDREKKTRKFSSLSISDAFASFQHHHSPSTTAAIQTETIIDANNTISANIQKKKRIRRLIPNKRAILMI